MIMRVHLFFHSENTVHVVIIERWEVLNTGTYDTRCRNTSNYDNDLINLTHSVAKLHPQF